MSADLNLTEKKKERQVAGLIALAAKKRSGITSCLTDAEMTMLAEGKCSEREKEKSWGHLLLFFSISPMIHSRIVWLKNCCQLLRQ